MDACTVDSSLHTLTLCNPHAGSYSYILLTTGLQSAWMRSEILYRNKLDHLVLYFQAWGKATYKKKVYK